MPRVRLDEDIRPLSKFWAGMATFVKHIHETRRPMALTQRGRGVVVLVDVHEYESMKERLEVFEEVSKAEEQIAAGDGIAHEEAKVRVMSKLAQ
ncbi:MAG: type II toxin-antitoxin system Phd/YefM family antitoxin [Alcanivoracaceae bacterium]